MAISFDGNKTINSPEAFKGVTLKSYIHPSSQYHDGYGTVQFGTPNINFSFGLFTIEAGHEWPATRFDIAEVSYYLEGEGVFICNVVEHYLTKGMVIYIPKGEVRIIRNIANIPFKYLCIVDPAWQSSYETVL